MFTEDKIKEARFHLRQMRLHLKQLNETTDHLVVRLRRLIPTRLAKLCQAHRLTKVQSAWVYPLDGFRYSFYAFVTAARSITFVLQKEYRRDHGEQFDKWYSEYQNSLSVSTSAKTVLKLRNIVLKEGSKFPSFNVVWKDEKENKITYIFYPFFEDEDEGVQRIVIEYGPGSGPSLQIPEDASEEEFKKYVMDALPELVPSDFISESLSTGKIISFGLILDEKHTLMSIDDVFALCDNYIRDMEHIAVEAKQRFSGQRGSEESRECAFRGLGQG